MESRPLRQMRSRSTKGGQGFYFVTGLKKKQMTPLGSGVWGRVHPSPALLQGYGFNSPETFNLKFLDCISKAKTPLQKMHFKKIRTGWVFFGLAFKKIFFTPKP